MNFIALLHQAIASEHRRRLETSDNVEKSYIDSCTSLWLSHGSFWMLKSSGAGRGAALYGKCVNCHGENGHGKTLALAPAIAGLPQWYERQLYNFKFGIRGYDTDLEGHRMRPMARMLRAAGEDTVDIEAKKAALMDSDPYAGYPK